MSLTADLRGRDGLGAAAERLAAGPGTIAYFGASVTVQRTGFVPILHEGLCRLWGHRHRRVDAGTGLGSFSAAFLTEFLVARHQPDLCFFEFLSGDLDGRTAPEQAGPGVETVVEKLMSAGCTPCLLHLFRTDVDLRLPNAVLTAYEKVAERHRVPSIDLTRPFAEVVASGGLDPHELLRDVVHTTPAGSQAVADAVLGAVRDLAGPGPRTAPGQTGPGRRPASLHGGRYRQARLAPAQPGWLRDPDLAFRGRFRLVLEHLLVEPGNPIEHAFDGRLCGLAAILGADPIALRVSAAGGGEQLSVWHPEAPYDHLDTVMFASEYPAGAPVRIEVVDTAGLATAAAATGGSGPGLRAVGALLA